MLYKEEIKKVGGRKIFFKNKIREKEPLIKEILNITSGQPARILEAGGGTGTISLFLSQKGHIVVYLDKDVSMLNIAKFIALNHKLKPTYIRGKIQNLPFTDKSFDICFSHGVLEHFSDEEIVNILKEQYRVSKYVIVSIPSDFFNSSNRMYGDERFLSVNHWRSLIASSGGHISKEFSYFHSSSKIKIRLLKLLMTLTRNILPLKKPYITFLIKHESY